MIQMASEKIPLYNYIIFNHVVLFVYILHRENEGVELEKKKKSRMKSTNTGFLKKQKKMENFGTGIALIKCEKEIRKCKRVSIYETYKEEM